MPTVGFESDLDPRKHREVPEHRASTAQYEPNRPGPHIWTHKSSTSKMVASRSNLQEDSADSGSSRNLASMAVETLTLDG